MKITKIYAREILDSRGNPTVEVDVYSGKIFARAAVPSGASTGSNEAVELRDNNKRFLGKGVMKAVSNINMKIAPKLKGMDVLNQAAIDEKMIALDKTKNKSKLGANAILGVSLAVAKLAAIFKNKPFYKYIKEDLLGEKKAKYILPVPCMNIINGGKHADNKLQFQEYMIGPMGKNFKESLRMGSEIYHILKAEIGRKFGKDSTNVGDEGGFAPNLNNVEQPLKLIVKAIKKAGYEGKVNICMDPAASEFYDPKKRKYFVDDKWITSDELLVIYKKLVRKYPIVSIEDPFHEEDFDAFAKMTKAMNIQIVGDDLLVTNPQRVLKAIELNACNALLLKVNQIGTLTEAIEAAMIAKMNGWNVMISHRSGETEDTTIADLAVALSTGQIKSGAPARSERLAKYNQLLRIEEELGKNSKYPKRFGKI